MDEVFDLCEHGEQGREPNQAYQHWQAREESGIARGKAGAMRRGAEDGERDLAVGKTLR